MEIEEAARLQKESEDFLARQAEMFASMTGLGTGEGTSSEPKKLSLLNAQPSKAKASAASATATSGEEAKPKPAKAVFGGDDEDESANKKKRELIPLSYSDDEDDETNIEKKKRKLKDLVSAIPTDKAGLWQYAVRWDKLDEVGCFLIERTRLPQTQADSLYDASGRPSCATRCGPLRRRSLLSISVQKSQRSSTLC